MKPSYTPATRKQASGKSAGGGFVRIADSDSVLVLGSVTRYESCMVRYGLLWLMLLSPAVAHAADSTPPSADEVKLALRKASGYLISISTEGGYLWRYSPDLSERWGENKATTTQIWVQPPGTPSVGMTFLDAYSATKDERHLAAAQSVALALVRGQLESGGWDYLIEFDPKVRRNWFYRADPPEAGAASARRKNVTTFDDDNTQSALRFLATFVSTATNRHTAELKVIREALDYGLTRMIEAQYPNGAWPQRYDGKPHDPQKFPTRPARVPKDWLRIWPKADYGGFYTLNDRSQQDCIRTMLEAYKHLGEAKYLDSAKKGGEFLVLARLPEPQPAWAQQYNFDMEPAWARAFEPPAVCSNESADAMRMLVDLFLETGEQRFLEPIPAFVAWLKRSQIGTDRWARYYELETNKPIYGDRDGKIHYTVQELSEERQRGYAWEGSFGIPETIAHYEAVRAEGRENFLKKQKHQTVRGTPSPRNVANILSVQDSQGRWLTNDQIEMRRFIANMRALTNYLRNMEQVPGASSKL
jgi:hypothetical protein